MSATADAVFAKTPRGTDEVATRKHGLAMRLRRLLILVDGRRTAADLSKLVPEPDLPGALQQLETEGFVARVGAEPPAAAGLRAGEPLPVDAAAAASAAASASAAGLASPIGGAEPAPEPAAPPAPAPAVPATLAPHEFETVRRLVVRQLVEVIGPNADDLAVRLERCRSIDELRRLVPAATKLVEAIRGRTAALEFERRIGPV